MIFLNPAVLIGLLAASIPVIIHLFNLRKLKKIEFSTIIFLKELQKTKIRKIKLKQWILLFLRTMIIISLVAAFARPTVEQVTLSAGSSSAKTSAVFIIDNSFSMSVISANGSYLNHAKEIADKILNEFEEGDEIAVITTDGYVNAFDDRFTNKANALKILEDIELSYVRKPLDESILKAVELIESSKNYNKEVFVYSDFQKSAFEQREIFLPTGDDIRLYLIYLSDKTANNFYVRKVEPGNQIFEKSKIVNFVSEVAGSAGSNQQSITASLFINGIRSAQRNAELTDGESIALNFEALLSQSGLLEITVEIDDDDISQDNRRFSSLLIPEKIKILLLSDTNSDFVFVRTALRGSSSGVIDITEAVHSRINSFNLNDYDAVFLSAAGDMNVKKIKDYLNAGGNVILFPSSSLSLEGFKNITGNLGINLNSTMIDISAADIGAAVFDKIDFAHPVFSDLFEMRKQQIESPDIFRYIKFTSIFPGAKIISLIDDSVFLCEFNLENGKVMLFNTAPVTGWSSFPLKGIFAPLMNKIVFYLSSQNKTGKNYKAGEMIDLTISSEKRGSITVIRPDGSKDFLQTDTLITKRNLTYAQTNLTGIYKFYSGDELFDFAGINIDPLESQTEYIDINVLAEIIKNKGFLGKIIEILPGENYSEQIYQSRFGIELWKYFLAAALIMALVEMLISRSSKKELASLEN